MKREVKLEVLTCNFLKHNTYECFIDGEYEKFERVHVDDLIAPWQLNMLKTINLAQSPDHTIFQCSAKDGRKMNCNTELGVLNCYTTPTYKVLRRRNIS